MPNVAFKLVFKDVCYVFLQCFAKTTLLDEVSVFTHSTMVNNPLDVSIVIK